MEVQILERFDQLQEIRPEFNFFSQNMFKPNSINRCDAIHVGEVGELKINSNDLCELYFYHFVKQSNNKEVLFLTPKSSACVYVNKNIGFGDCGKMLSFSEILCGSP